MRDAQSVKGMAKAGGRLLTDYPPRSSQLGTHGPRAYSPSMITRVTLADCSGKIGEYLDGALSHEQLVEWAREAMLATDIPSTESAAMMDLLQDISLSTPRSLREAAKHYRAFTSPLTRGIGRWPGPN